MNRLGNSKNDKVTCLLCFCLEHDEQLINIASTESQQQRVATVLYTHFRFCFHEEPVDGSVCQKCWVKVSVFHEFYTHIDYVHRSNDTVFAECIATDLKTSADAESDEWEASSAEANFPDYFDDRDGPISPQKREPSPSRECDTVKLEDFSAESYHYQSDGGLKEAPLQESKEVKVETAVKSNEKEETKKKRGRPRKYCAADPPKIEPVGPSKCSRCPLEFSSLHGLWRHIKSDHNVLPFPCKLPRCVESFATLQEQEEHLSIRHKQVDCPHCQKTFLETNLRKHIRVQHGAQDDNFMCDICGHISNSNSKHKAHYQKWHTVQNKVQCDICKLWTKHKQSLRRHMIRQHIDGPQKCDVCGHVSPNRRSLWEHNKKHLPDYKTRYKCDYCGRGFTKRSALVEHSHIHTGFVGSYHCGECGKIFRFNSSFYVHKKKMHPK